MIKIKQYIPILVFAVTIVLSGISIITSKELEKRKYIPPERTEARGCTPAEVSDGSCPPEYVESINNGSWVPEYNSDGAIKAYYSRAESPDPSAREQSAPPPAASTPPPSTNTPTSTPTKTPTPTATLTPTSTPTSTLTPTASPSITPTPSASPSVTPTPSMSPSVTQTPTPTTTPGPSSFRHKICQNNACVEVNCVPSNQPCESTCSSDVSCQPAAVTPATPKAGGVIPTIMTIAGGAGLFILGLVLAL